MKPVGVEANLLTHWRSVSLQTWRTRSLRLLLVAAPVAFFLGSATAFIALPGLYYDETLFVNAALGGPSDVFVHSRIGTVPVMLMPYLGALKAYVYAPIFLLFGVSPASIRVPAILISVGTLLLAYRVGRRLFGPGLALVLLVLMASDPSFIFHTKLDWGPIVVSCFLKVLALWLYFEFLSTGSLRLLVALGGVLALGIFDKANFIWFVNALAVAAAVVHGRMLWRIVARNPVRALAALAAAMTMPGIVAWLVVRPLMADGRALSFEGMARVKQIIDLVIHTFEGGAVWQFTRGSEPPAVSVFLPVFVFSLAVLPVVWVYGWKSRAEVTSDHTPRAVALFALITLLIGIQIMATEAAGGSHHAMMLWPFHHVIVVGAAAAVRDQFLASLPVRRSFRAVKLWSKGLAAGIFVILVVSQFGVDAAYLRSYASRTGFTPVWDPAIYQLSRSIEQRGATSTILLTDWGIGTQILSLAAPEHRRDVLDYWPGFNGAEGQSAADRNWWGQQLARPGVLIVAHSLRAMVMPRSRINLFALAREQRLRLEPLDTIAGSDGRPLFEIYRARAFDPPPTAAATTTAK